ncbi:MAG: hypothetical protein JRG80_19305 [Deltaproteobacteria bacterium]|nr:hypothetical protein [Deltaproteobacteria bacterium]
MLRTRWTEEWEGPESPGTLPMPLQLLATADATQRAHRAALAGNAAAAELNVTIAGQIVGSMNQVRPAKKVVSDVIDELFDTVERMARLIEE